MKVLILQGGCNEEHKVSLNTAKQIGKTLKKLKIDFKYFTVNPNTFEKDILKYSNQYICFNALHGPFGEDGAIQKILKKNKFRFTHSNQISSTNCFDKEKSKKIIKKFKIKTQLRKDLQSRGHLSREDFQFNRTTTLRDVPGQWHERGSNNLAGRIRTADVDYENGQIYCASSGGNIWRGNLDGTGWESLNDYFQITGIHFLKRFDYDVANRLLMVDSKHCYRSDNDGLIIDDAAGLGSFQGWGWIFRGIVKNSPQPIIYLGVVEWDYTVWTYLPSIYKSTDGGESFTRIAELTSANGFTVGTSHFDMWTPQMENGDVYVLNDGDCYILSDNDELTLVGDFSPSGSGNNILIGGVDDGQVFLHCRVGSQQYTSLDGGGTWENRGTLPTGTFTINSFECNPYDPNKLVIGNVDGYRSTNGGNSWNLINHWWEYYSAPATKLHADLPEFTYFIDPVTEEEFQLISTDGGIYISYDQFNTVQNLSLSGLGVSQYYSTYTKRT